MNRYMLCLALSMMLLIQVARASQPQVGDAAPEINAKSWINSQALTLRALKDKVVVLEFFLSFCSHCQHATPHLINLHNQYKDRGVIIIGLTEEAESKIGEFMENFEVPYAVGTESTSRTDYGVPGVPHSVVIGQDGKIAWFGHPESGLDAAIEAALTLWVSRVDPSSGSIEGGRSVTIRGNRFASGATVAFGGVQATEVVVRSETEISCRTPAHAAGAVDVVVTNADAQSATLGGGFTYISGVFTSGPAASPNPAVVNNAVLFSCRAATSDGDPITINWDFGDGTTGSGESTSHAYASAGTYSVSITTVDPNGNTTGTSLSVVVTEAGAGGTTTGAMTVTTMRLKLNFKDPEKDTCSVIGIGIAVAVEIRE